MKKTYEKFSKYGSIAILSLFCVVLYIILLGKSQDNDMFFEIMSGRDILNGNFHTISHADDFPIIVQQWLYAVCMAIFDKFGYIGNLTFVFIQDVILYIVSYIFIYRRTHDKKKSCIGPALAILYCYNYMINIRPQIITVIFLVSELIFLDMYKEKKQLKYLLPIFPILVLSANFHQSVFLYHIFIMVPYWLGDSLMKQLEEVNGDLRKITKCELIDWKLVCFSALFLPCSLLTPYGLDGALYIFKTFKSNTYDFISISELQPMHIFSYDGVCMLILVALAILLIYLRKSNRYVNFYVFAVFLLALLHIRHTSIEFIPVLFVICAANFKKLHDTYFYSAIAFLCIVLCVVHVKGVSNVKYDYGKVAESIQDKDAYIYNTAMDLGGYLEYNGCTKVHLDSRCEAYSEEISGIPNIMEEYFALTRGYWYSNNNNVITYDIAEDDELLYCIKDYKYLVSNRMDYINRVVKDDTDTWTKLFDDGKYIVWENVTIE